MFTGIIEKVGRIRQIIPEGKRIRFVFQLRGWNDLKIGESIAVNGTCLTIVSKKKGAFSVQVIPATLKTTNLKYLKKGDLVNLERSLRAQDRLSGHWVQGHIDGTGKISKIKRIGDNLDLHIHTSPDIMCCLVDKASVAVDGISLTIQSLSRDSFTVSIIPHTLNVTNLRDRRVGDWVNLEVDILAKYIAEFLKRVGKA